MALREVITRRNLPHWFVPHAWHFVTYRLAETIPQAMFLQLRATRDQRWRTATHAGNATAQLKEQLHKQFFAAYDQYLDLQRNIDWLAQPKIAAIIRGNLHHHNGTKFQLLAYCVMPNHVHVLLRALDPAATSGLLVGAGQLATEADKLTDEMDDSKGPLSQIMHSLKSYTAHEANKILGRKGTFWQHESYDHWVRDEEELQRIVHYIIWNPVKAKLAEKPHLWFFGSAHDRFIQDGSEEGYLLS